MKFEFSQQIFGKKAQISSLMKTCHVGVELFHADGRTDRRDEVNNRFSQFCECA